MAHFGYPTTTLARICKCSYEYENKRFTVLKELLGNEFKIMSEYSNKNILTVSDDKNIIIAFRGTDLTRDKTRAFKDLLQDVNIAIGKNERVSRIQEGSIMINNILRNVEKKNLLITGHSLGAFAGVNLSEKFNVRAVLFNIGSSPLDSRGVRRNITNIIHITTNDLRKIPPVIDILSISALFLFRFKYYIVPVKKGLSTHTIDNFI
jgi:hypothetical protein